MTKQMIFLGVVVLTAISNVSDAMDTSSLLHYPTTKDELIALVKDAAEKKIRVTPCGSFGSHEMVVEGFPGQHLINMRRLNRILSINLKDNTVTVEAGILMGDLLRELAKMGLTLVDHVATPIVTLGGILSTGAHGESLVGYLPDYVNAVELIDGRGDTITISEKSFPELLPAVRVSLGCLGIIYSVTLQCIPLYTVEHNVEMITLDYFIQHMDDYLQEYDHLRFYVNPYDGLVRLEASKRTNKKLQNNNLYYATYKIVPLIKHKISSLSLSHESKNFSHQKAVAKRINQFFKSNVLNIVDSDINSTTYFDLGKSRVDYIPNENNSDPEVAIPVSVFPEAIKMICDMVKELSGQNFFSLDKFHFRFNKGSGKTYLGEVAEGYSLWVSSPLVSANCGQFIDGSFIFFSKKDKDVYLAKSQEVLQKLENRLISLGGRPHWGKTNFLSKEKVIQLYGKDVVAKFIQARRRLDPEGIFLKPYTQKLFE